MCNFFPICTLPHRINVYFVFIYENSSLSSLSACSLTLCVCIISCFRCFRVFVTLWVVACQAPLSMGFSRQEYWSRLAWPPPGDLPNPENEPVPFASSALQVDSLSTEPPGKPILSYSMPHKCQRPQPPWPPGPMSSSQPDHHATWLGQCLQAKNQNTGRNYAFIPLLSAVTVLRCLLSNDWRQFHILYPVF